MSPKTSSDQKIVQPGQKRKHNSKAKEITVAEDSLSEEEEDDEDDEEVECSDEEISSEEEVSSDESADDIEESADDSDESADESEESDDSGSEETQPAKRKKSNTDNGKATVESYVSKKVVARNLSYHTTEDELCDELEADDAIIITDMAGNSKRFGFLLYLTEEDAANAVKNMNGHRIHNKPVTLNFARDRKHSENVASIYAGNLSYKTDKDALQGAFKNAVDAHIAVDGIKPKGFGYVDFMSHDDAEAALQETITLDGRVLKLQWPARDKKKHGNQGTTLHIGNLTDDTTQEDVEDTFTRATKVQLIVDKNTKKSKGFAFVEFRNHQDAAAAVKRWNKKELDGNKIKVDYKR